MTSEGIMHILTSRVFLTILASLVIIAGVFLFASYQLDHWTETIVETNTELTKQTVRRIADASLPVLDSLSSIGLFQKENLTKEESRALDTLLASIVEGAVSTIIGMEGGFYFAHVDELLGYSWPTSTPPAPAYGPAPRSYPIIREQLIATVRQSRALVEYHEFDFATFPLATEPLVKDGVTVGAVWARIHVERELPSSVLARWLNYGIVLSLVTLFIVFLMSLRMRARIAAIRHGLERLQTDSAYRLPVQRGVFGAITSSINAMVDSRAREQLEREQLERDLHQQDKMAMLGKLVAGVAHEVKTPLAIIKTRIQLWQQDLRNLGPSAEAGAILSEDTIQIVLKEINRLSGLLKRLLVFSKPVGSNRKNVDLNKLVEQSASFIRAEADDRQIALTVAVDKRIPHLWIDSQAIEQVLLNVYANAMDAMAAGGMMEIQTMIESTTNSVLVFIRDTGHGIPPEVRNKVFDPFFTTKEHGAGLGLYISQEIVRSHGGTIDFRPRAQAGTECCIRLPLHTHDTRQS